MTDHPTLLLIEDEAQQREALTLVLESEGYTVVAVPSAEEALQSIRASKPALVVSDIKLTGLDGFTMFEQLRQEPPFRDLPFLFITGYNDLATIENAKRLGAAGYITKPYNLEELVALVRKLLPPS